MKATQDKQQICPLCKAGRSCDIAKGKTRCCCFELPALQQTKQDVKDCYCPNCLKKLLEEEKVSIT